MNREPMAFDAEGTLIEAPVRPTRLVLAIDPGPTRSAYLVFDVETQRPVRFDIVDNDELLRFCRHSLYPLDISDVVIEKVESFGMSVGAEVFETVFWSGRFAEAADVVATVSRLGRIRIKNHLCHSSKAKDSNIRQALIDRYGGPDAIGRKAEPGPLYGISKDVWSALAIAVTHVDQEGIAA